MYLRAVRVLVANLSYGVQLLCATLMAVADDGDCLGFEAVVMMVMLIDAVLCQRGTTKTNLHVHSRNEDTSSS